jgi:hypothetical protein
MKFFYKQTGLILALSLGCLVGCRQESREYLQALEAKDRLIESSHMARRDMINSLGSRSLAKADRAMEAEIKIEEKSLLIDSMLDSNRPHRPDPKLFAQAREQVKDLEQQRTALLGQWANAQSAADPQRAKDLSAKIRDVELELSEVSEIAKRSKPYGLVSDQIKAKGSTQSKELE